MLSLLSMDLIVSNKPFGCGLSLTLRVGRAPVSSYYLTTILLPNFMACLHNNKVSEALQCTPPMPQEYLGVLYLERDREHGITVSQTH